MTIVDRIKQLNLSLEHTLLGLIIFGLPLIAQLWFGWRATVTTLILTLIVLGIIKVRFS